MSRPYVEVCFNDSDRNSCDSDYYLTIVVGSLSFVPHDDSEGRYKLKEEANKAGERIAASLGIELKVAKD